MHVKITETAAAGGIKRCYTNPLSALAAGGVWTPTPPQIRECADCRIPLTYQYAAFAGLTTILCRPCRSRRAPGVSAVTRRACAGCGNLMQETRLYDGVCNPACARQVGVYAAVLPPDGVAEWQRRRAAAGLAPA